MNAPTVLPRGLAANYVRSGYRRSSRLVTHRMRTAALLIGTVVSAGLGQATRGKGIQQGRLPVEIRIELAQERFVIKESMVARIMIRNTGSSPIEVPNPENNRNTQPVYTISGPSYPKGYSFHFHGSSGDQNAAPQVEQSSLVKLDPGQTHEAALPL